MSVERILEAGGALSAVLPGYVHRASQVRMAADIEVAISKGTHLVAEAGTGTGKTFAYLLPALLSGKKIIVSTGTKTLQDQLFRRDVPLIAGLISNASPVVVLKGRNNYVCPERLFRSLDTESAFAERLLQVRDWYSRTRSGDITELLDAERERALIPLVTSSAEDCLAHECPRIAECPMYRARERAAAADIVIVNHHLLFADFALQDDSLASILPAAEVIIADEAHQLADVARQFFGMRLGSRQLSALARDVRSEVTLLGNDDPRLGNLASLLDSQLARLIDCLRQGQASSLVEILRNPEASAAIADVDLTLVSLVGALSDAAVRSRMLKQCYQRGRRLLDTFALVTEENQDPDFAHWIAQSQAGFVMHLTPLSVARDYRDRVNDSGKTWIFTSATLTVGEKFDFFARELGLEDVDSRRYESPFDFRSQVRGWVPNLSSRPGTDEHTNELVDQCLPVLKQVSGRAFFLVTSYRALDVVSNRLAREPGVSFVAQGALSRAALLQRFRRTERCVLVATHSFWEGVDVRGADLKCLVIDKLPFASPADPLVKAFLGSMQRRGCNGFFDYLVPDAAITLRQGFGRLIREETDRGIFVLGDQRTLSMSYGKLFLKSLPDIEWMPHQDAAIDYVTEHLSEPAGR